MPWHEFIDRVLRRRAPPKGEDRQLPAADKPPAESLWVGPRDEFLSGWYGDATNELFTGFAIRPEDVVLDIGCGLGRHAHFCAMRGAYVIFADIEPATVANAARLLSLTPARGLSPLVTDSGPLPLADASATRIIATEVIEHVDDPTRFLSELARVGKPGCRYLLTAPDPVAEMLQKQLAPPIYFSKPNHVRIIEREEFGKWVEGAGLVIEQRHTYGFYRALWWLLFWTCKVEMAAPSHPLLDSWTEAWSALLDTEDGIKVKRALDGFMPKTQLILARKP